MIFFPEGFFPAGTAYTFCLIFAASMRTVAIFILIAGIMLQPFSSVLVLMEYELNKDFIISRLCVNRDKPAMHCNGKCHLQKQMAASEEKEQTNSGGIKEKQPTDLYTGPVNDISLSVTVTSFTHSILQDPSLLRGFTTAPFHPPALLIS